MLGWRILHSSDSINEKVYARDPLLRLHSISLPEIDRSNKPKVTTTVDPTANPLVDPIPVEQTAPESHAIAYRGFTHEEELFRTKWGWAAFDQVQKTLREDADEEQ